MELRDKSTNGSVIVDTVAIIIGLIGTVLNALLFWVLSRNTSIDKKCCLIYQNLAAVDVFNCLVIPLCYLTLNGHGYQFELKDSKNSILYLLFGATVNIPYMLLILLSVARVMIFRHQVLYTQRVSLGMVRALCVVCWFLSIGGLGIWMCCLLRGSAEISVLVDLLKLQSVAFLIFTLVTLILITVSIAIIQNMISHMKRDSVATRRASVQSSMSGRESVQSSRSGRLISESTALLSPNQLLVKELSAAKRTFFYFFWSILLCSSFPIAFSSSFVLCGPYYNSTRDYCQPIQIQAFKDPKTSYAIMLLFLCGMSITNSIILLKQRSFKVTMRRLCNWLIGVESNSREVPGAQNVGINSPGLARIGIKERIVKVMTRTGRTSPDPTPHRGHARKKKKMGLGQQTRTIPEVNQTVENME